MDELITLADCEAAVWPRHEFEVAPAHAGASGPAQIDRGLIARVGERLR